MGDFVHLHVHSEFSLLDGLTSPGTLCQSVAQAGMKAVALTDHGQMYGIIKFYQAAIAAGIKPIIGCEVYQAPRRLYQKEPKRDSKAYHLILLAQSRVGYQNLLKLVTTANLEGFYYRPRIDKELLAEHAEGLVCLSACLSGQIPSLIAQGQLDQARNAIGWFKDLFGPDRFFLELQRHAGLANLEPVNQQLVAFAKEFGLRTVATNDVHYMRQQDARTQELLLAIQTNTTMSDPDRMRMGGDDYYLMAPDEMALHMSDYPEALETTLLIADQCQASLDFDSYHLPKFDVPGSYTAEAYLRELCEDGLLRRYPDITPQMRERLDYELGVIHSMGFDDYFLINHDLVDWAKTEAKMLVGPGRGSGASSIVAYVLGITELEPLGLGLIFERFLNPGRVTMPDIDLDYPDDRRQEVIDYLAQRYGTDRTSQIATFGTMAARGAIRDVGRALGIPLSEVDHAAKLVPFGPKRTIQNALDNVPELKELYDNQPYIKEMLDYALGVQGVSRHLSTHAAGVLIADKPLVEYTPLQRAPSGDGLIAQYTMEDVEEIGLLKLDVLGLSTLTVLDRAFAWIERTCGVTLTQASIPMDDPDTYGLLATGQVTGIFQVESGGMRRMLRDMQATEFEDIVALLALYRPGPMQFIPNFIDRKFGREPITYHHPSLEPVLVETYGIIVYQEQILRIATDLAGYSASEADLMRRAVSKKKREDLEKQHAKFVSGAIANGIAQDVAEAIYTDIEFFADYGFPKSHSAGYAVITLQTAYLKAHYPVEYMAAMLSVERGNLEKIARLTSECRRLSIAVRPPDVNRSDVDFTIEPADCQTIEDGRRLLGVEKLALRYGLGAVKNVGDGPAQLIVEARGNTPFADIEDFGNRVDLRQVNKRALECLMRAGALDTFGNRNALLSCLDQLLGVSQQLHRAREIGQRSLFDLNPDAMGLANGVRFDLPKRVRPLAENERLAAEKELLGAYTSAHPLDLLSKYIDDALTTVSDIDDSMDGERIQIAGMIDAVRMITTKKGDQMAFAQLEDLSGSMELVIFPRTFEDSKDLLAKDALVRVDAKVQVREDEPKLIADFIAPYQLPDNARLRRPTRATAKHLTIEIALGRDERQTADIAERVFAVLAENHGDVPFSVYLTSRRGGVEIAFPDVATAYTPQLEQQIVSLVGRDRFRVDWA